MIKMSTTITNTTVRRLRNYAAGEWVEGAGAGQTLYNAINGDPVAIASSAGLDFKLMMEYARSKGGPGLRKMTFHARGNMLKALAMHLRKHLDHFYKVS